MAKHYASEAEKLIPFTLKNKTLIAIGRLVRAFAEIEDLVKLFICNLAEISESRMIVIMGRTPLRTLINTSEYLAQMQGEKVLNLHKSVFTPEFFEALSCRNSVAHGVLLGADKHLQLAFKTTDTLKPEEDAAIVVVRAYHSDLIAQYAEYAERAIPTIRTTLKLETLLEKRREAVLAPHPKGLKQSKNSAKQKLPPQS